VNVKKLIWKYRRTRAIRVNRRERLRVERKARRDEKLEIGQLAISQLVWNLATTGGAE